MRTSRLSVVSATLAILICLTVGLPSLVSASPLGEETCPPNGGGNSNNNGCPPADAGDSFTWTGACTFPIELSLTGDGKLILLPGNSDASPRFIQTSPGLYVTLTNAEDSSKHVTLNITGSFHDTTDEHGIVWEKMVGRNLTWDETTGLVLIIGNFLWAHDADGNVVQHLTGTGQILNVCDMIS